MLTAPPQPAEQTARFQSRFLGKVRLPCPVHSLPDSDSQGYIAKVLISYSHKEKKTCRKGKPSNGLGKTHVKARPRPPRLENCPGRDPPRSGREARSELCQAGDCYWFIESAPRGCETSSSSEGHRFSEETGKPDAFEKASSVLAYAFTGHYARAQKRRTVGRFASCAIPASANIGSASPQYTEYGVHKQANRTFLELPEIALSGQRQM